MKSQQPMAAKATGTKPYKSPKLVDLAKVASTAATTGSAPIPDAPYPTAAS